MKQTQNIAMFCAVMVIGSLLATVPAMAGTAVAPAGKTAKTVVQEVQKSCITGDLGVSLTNAYIARGLVLDKDTLIAQPYLDLYFKLYEGEGFLNSVRFALPLWASIHDINKPSHVSTTKDWYEFDIDPGLIFTLAKNWTLSISDYILSSPGDYFNTTNNLVLGLKYDDSDLLGAFALHPHFTFWQELNNHSGLGRLTGTKHLGQYYELGIAPSYTLEKDSAYPVTLTLPATVGFGTNGYYGQGFGYFSIGGTASIPLPFIPTCYGSWTTSLSGLYYRLGSDASLTDNPNRTTSGRRDQGVVSWSIGTAF
jgi:hypothetical protein